MLYCTAMIYASLKPIRQWCTGRVPLGFILIGHASGALLLLALSASHGVVSSGLAWLALALVVGALLAKLEYWRFVHRPAGAVTIERAIGVAQGVRPPPGRGGSVMAARLLDAGHSRGTFLTREFLYRADPARRAAIRVIAITAGFVLPGALVVLGGSSAAALWPAFVVCLAGLIAERWLFFAEARHTVRLYHGERST
jgi:DMSO reductase anchor subunit